ncbi:MAG: TIGR03560 family F420-dependent LLM class oxidoreductase, partial [Candidatus Kariarchaeaceae archaeon]
PQISSIIRRTEERGYHSFYTCDHFFLDKSDASVDRHTIEAWTILAAAAVITDKIKLGTLVTGNNYRNPALLAKIAASVDAISSGRMEFGIGAGWKQEEYEAYGYEFPSVKDRMDQLEDAMEIVTKLFNEKRPSYSGKHHSIDDAIFSPRPDNPLIMIGGGGEKRTLKMVAKYADYCNLFNNLDLEGLERKLDALKGHCQAIGRDYEEVGKSMFIFGLHVTEDPAEVDQIVQARAQRFNRSVEEVRALMFPANMPGGWVGTPEQVRDRIEFLQGYGFDYFLFQQPLDTSRTTIDSFADLVMDKYFR